MLYYRVLTKLYLWMTKKDKQESNEFERSYFLVCLFSFRGTNFYHWNNPGINTSARLTSTRLGESQIRWRWYFCMVNFASFFYYLNRFRCFSTDQVLYSSHSLHVWRSALCSATDTNAWQLTIFPVHKQHVALLKLYICTEWPW